MRHDHQRGLLLMEALVALSLLVTGVSAVALAFQRTRDVISRGGLRSALASCAQEKILAETAGVNASGACDEIFIWERQVLPLSPRLNCIRLTASWNEEGRTYEETFEAVR